MQSPKEDYSEKSYRHFWKPFFGDIRNWLAFFAVALSLLLVFFIFFHKKDLIIFPHNGIIDYVLYDDSSNTGHSRIVDFRQTDSCMQVSFILREGFINPFIGIRFFPDNQDKELNISDYNQLSIKVSGTPISHLILYLITADRQVRDPYHPLAHRHSGTGISISSRAESVTLPFNNFHTPDWWYEEIDQLPHEFASPELQHFTGFSVTTGIRAELNVAHRIDIYSIVFQKNNTVILYGMAAIQGLTLLLLLLRYYTSRKQTDRIITVNYKPVAVEAEKPDQTKSFLDYIHTHFSDPELSLKAVSRYSGVHQRVITETIANRFDCNFKTYINQIRIKEAQRLLKESGLNISEIAYKVGFNSPSNFNRVFKNLTGKNPTEFIREN